MPSCNEMSFLISMQCLLSHFVNEMSSFKSILMNQKKSDQMTGSRDMRWYATCNLKFGCEGELWMSTMFHLDLYYVLIKLFSFSFLGKMYKCRNTGYCWEYKFTMQLARHKA